MHLNVLQPLILKTVRQLLPVFFYLFSLGKGEVVELFNFFLPVLVFLYDLVLNLPFLINLYEFSFH